MKAGPNPEPMTVEWFVAQIRPGQYERARVNLSRQGYEVVMPRLRLSVRRGGRSVVECKPLFPGYAFIREPDVDLDWRPINATYGVVRLLRGPTGAPAVMPKGFVESLLDMTNEAGLLSAPPAVAPGDDVEIVAGPFAGVIGKVITLTSTGRIRLLLDLLGRSVRTEVEQAAVDIVPSKKAAG